MMNSEYIKFIENDKNSVSDAIKPILSVGEFFFEAGAQSRQAEIDGLKKVIDEALIKINKAPNQLSYNDAIEALLILKGKNND